MPASRSASESSLVHSMVGAASPRGFAGLVTRCTNAVQPDQHLPERAKVLQILQVVLSEFALLDGHAEHYAGLNQQAQLALGCAAFAVHPAQISCRTGLGTQLFCRSTRGHEFLTCGIRVWATDKLETCRHGGQHMSCRTGLGMLPFFLGGPARWYEPGSAKVEETRRMSDVLCVPSQTGWQVGSSERRNLCRPGGAALFVPATARTYSTIMPSSAISRAW